MIDTRSRLVEATQELLWDRGYAATSPRAILAIAGVGQGSMYHHFDGKEALSVAALQSSADALIARAAAVLGGDGRAVAKIHRYLLAQREVLRGCPVGRMASDPDVLESRALHEVITRTFRQVRDLLVAVAAAGVQQGELRADVDPAELADMILAVVQGGYVLARAAGDREPFDRAVRGAAALVDLARSVGQP